MLGACWVVSHNVDDFVLRAETRVVLGARGVVVPLYICQLQQLAACCGVERRAYTKLRRTRCFSARKLCHQFNDCEVAFNVDASVVVTANGNQVIC